jgi:hypothetical protein
MLGRLHRSNPLAEDVRIDTLLARLREVPTPGRGHRGGARFELSDADWMTVVDRLAAAQRLVRRGRRVRLPEHRSELGPEMRRRADTLLEHLRSAGLSGARSDVLARRVGLPPPLLDALARSGELVRLGAGVDLAGDVYRGAWRRILELPEDTRLPGTVARVLGTSRRVASALLATPPPVDG